MRIGLCRDDEGTEWSQCNEVKPILRSALMQCGFWVDTYAHYPARRNCKSAHERHQHLLPIREAPVEMA